MILLKHVISLLRITLVPRPYLEEILALLPLCRPPCSGPAAPWTSGPPHSCCTSGLLAVLHTLVQGPVPMSPPHRACLTAAVVCIATPDIMYFS